jgi:hypothetical protein
MRMFILALVIGLFISCYSDSQSFHWSSPDLYVCKENSRKNCDCCKIVQGSSFAGGCAVANEADRLFMPCVDAREFGYKVEK